MTFVYGTIKGYRINKATSDQVMIIGGDPTNPNLSIEYPGFSISKGAGLGIQSAQILSVTRRDGLPDNCGNPFPQPQNPSPRHLQLT